LAFIYLLAIVLPNAAAVEALQAARAYYGLYHQELALSKQKKTVYERGAHEANAESYLRQRILPPLEQAATFDPQDSYPHIELAHWYEQRWLFTRQEEDRKSALKEADRAIDLDPENPEGYWVRWQIHFLAAQQNPKDLPGVREYDRQAARDLQQIVNLAPTNPVLHYRLAEAFARLADKVERRHEAQAALDCEARCPAPSRKLTATQRRQAQEWVKE
jgi:tetratricopeptide (TPR) repeat protein